MLAVGLVAACSSGSSDDAMTADPSTTTTVVDVRNDGESPSGDPTPSTGAPIVRDPGQEPRVLLALGGSAQTTITIDAVDERRAAVAGEVTEDRRAAVYDMTVDVSAAADGFELRTAPTNVSIDGPRPTDLEIGTLRWLVDPNGVTRRMVPEREPGTSSAATLALFHAPHLVLATPAEPVGVGAVWVQPLDGSSDAQLVVTVNDITETDLEVTIELVAPTEGGSLTIDAAGTYDRATLLARRVEATSTLEIDTSVSVDGTTENLIGVRRSQRTYTEASE